MIHRNAPTKAGQRAVEPKPADKKTTNKTFRLDGPASSTAGPAEPPRTAPTAVARTLEQLEKQRRSIDRLLDQAARGRDFSPGQLLRLQTTVYRYAQDLELLSRVVDRTVGALKTTLNTQV